MDWTMIISVSSVLVPLSGLIIGCFKSLSNDIRHIDGKVQRIEERMQVLDGRMSRMEGAFEERGRWESKK